MARSPLTERRASGILLHPTSLPGPGIGDLGAAAHAWVDWLARAGQTFWQVLPLVPVGDGGSPYDGLSAMAGSPLLISPELLVSEGLLTPEDLEPDVEPVPDRVDFAAVTRWKDRLLRRAYGAYRAGWGQDEARRALAGFREREAGWLPDFALWMAIRESQGGAGWTTWPAELRDRDPEALQRAAADLRDDVERHEFVQWLFDRQWSAVHAHAAARGVRVIGDVPIFVAHDSADVWANRHRFELDGEGNPTVVSGVPPDYFSETGQRWGNPLYRWEVMARDGYRWWVERFRRTLALVDVARVDHFRGFESYWEIPAGEETAIHGTWKPGPGRRLFDVLERELGPVPLIAEDLGLITPEVEALRDALGLPGMRVLQFAFGEGDEENPHDPAKHPENAVAYTGTHDNDTAAGWAASVGARERAGLERALGPSEGDLHWRMIDATFRSRAAVAIVPFQDVLGLGSDARMNTPGSARGNWAWRVAPGAATPELAARLREATLAAGRVPPAER
jgi:4-alpha-glucanotransferase